MVPDSSGRRGTNARKGDTTTTPSLRKPRANGKPARFPLGLQLSTSKVPAEPWPPRVREKNKVRSTPEPGTVQSSRIRVRSSESLAWTARGVRPSADSLPGTLTRRGNQSPGSESVGGALPSGLGLKTILAQPKQTLRH